MPEQIRNKNIDEIFEDYLKKKKLRKTQERVSILEEIKKAKSFFTVDSLFMSLGKKNYHVSRATAYNTVELLVSCGLLRKFNFNNVASYQLCTLEKDIHYHLICVECGKIKQINDSELSGYFKAKKYSAFTPIYSKIEVKGICSGCERKKKKKKKKKE